jgi:hypothetical protein
MIRTRDYFLIIISIAFLLVGIGATVAESFRNTSPFDISKPLVFVPGDGEVDRTATISDTITTARAERLDSLRKKIAAGGLLTIADPVPEPETVASTSEEVIGSGPTEQIEQRCTNYQTFASSWPTAVLFDEAEGARVVYVETAVATPPTSSSTTPLVFAPARNILLELPVRSASLGAQNCIPTDVIGIALDGSLIRNSAASVYGIFGGDTLVGYALDGYPIYGNRVAQTDRCGGLLVSGQYRYQISSEREAIINCYSGSPVKI